MGEKNDNPTPPHASTIDSLAAALGVDPSRGLNSQDLPARQKQYGPNALCEAPPASRWLKFFRQFNEVVIWVLIVAAIVSGILGEWTDAIAIVAIVLINGMLGFFQEERAGEALAALKKLAAPQSRAWRDGKLVTLPANDLLPGDRIELEAGDLIPADVRLISSTAFRVDEAALTGESSPVDKDAQASLAVKTDLADRRNMAFLGTIASAGKASALVVGTGMQTELGNIAGMLQSGEPEPTPLQRRLADLGRLLVYICLGVVAIIFALQLLRGSKLQDAFLLAVSLAVAAVPEGLPAVVTIALALGLQRMVKRHVLIRRLPSVETLGSVTVICSDKTGTLTRNEMTVREVYAGGRRYDVTGSGYVPEGEIREVTSEECRVKNEADRQTNAESTNSGASFFTLHSSLTQTLTIGARCNSARISRGDSDGDWHLTGDPTEGALVVAAMKAGIDDANRDHQWLYEIPFDSDRKLMTVLALDADGQSTFYTKGAPEVLLARCTQEKCDTGIRELSDDRRAEIMATNAHMASRALRVLAMAFRDGTDLKPDAGVECDMTFAGLVGMFDPPREEARAAVAQCKGAGVRTVMITGDHPDTALAIARELEIASEQSAALTGAGLEEMDDAALGRHVADASVFARVTASHKLRIVRALQAGNHVVAMTGDGVNDAPAVKAADIGIAMGKGGTDVTRQAADMVLTDDNFASIVAAVEEGRGVFDDIRKVVHYLLGCNTGEVLFMFIGALIGWQSPLNPIQILWINLVTDALPALALGIEPPEPDAMARPPRPTNEGVITLPRAMRMLFHGTLIAGATLAGFALMHHFLPDDRHDHVVARTVAFCILSYSQLFYSFACRSDRYTLPQLGFFSNKSLIGAIILSGLIQTAVFLPHLHKIFHVGRGLTWEWGVILTLSLLPVTIIEVIKLLRKKEIVGSRQ